jgi:hypothetical protein
MNRASRYFAEETSFGFLSTTENNMIDIQYFLLTIYDNVKTLIINFLVVAAWDHEDTFLA